VISLLDQLLRAQSGEGTSSQHLTLLSPLIALLIIDPQNLETNPTARPQGTKGIPITHPIMFAQVLTIIDLTIGESYGVKSFGHPKQDKWVAWEEKFRVVEGFDVYDLVRAAKICLIPNVVVPKEFRVPEFVKYTE